MIPKRLGAKLVVEYLGTLVLILFGNGVVAISVSCGGMHGYATSPARDFGPRLFTVSSAP